ncbi:hypothetical protein DWUX_190 [Desulfovibrio diazotrophicus]|nr:hypothetical protein DWUX_190 [Desulfovibrio diazotrophicus]
MKGRPRRFRLILRRCFVNSRALAALARPVYKERKTGFFL